MTRNEAKLELFKVNRNIEKKVAAHANELGQFNKNCVFNDLQRLWDRKKTLTNNPIKKRIKRTQLLLLFQNSIYFEYQNFWKNFQEKKQYLNKHVDLSM